MKLTHLAAALLVASGSSAALADVLVVRASGPSAKSYPAGKTIADNARITLQANDSIVLLDGRGTRVLRGPGSFTPSGPTQASNRTASASAATPARRARIGAVRSVGAAPLRSPSIWHVDIAKSSAVCLADPNNVMLWRVDATQPETMTVTRASDNISHRLEWAAGQTTLLWPSELPIADGADYRLSRTSAAVPTVLTFHTLPAKPGGLEEMASVLIQNGCEAQLDLLIETVKIPDSQTLPTG